MKKEGLDCLIKWLSEIQEGKEPLIPYNFHELVRLFHDNLGTDESVRILTSLKHYKEE